MICLLSGNGPIRRPGSDPGDECTARHADILTYNDPGSGMGMVNLPSKKTAKGVCLGPSGGETGCDCGNGYVTAIRCPASRGRLCCRRRSTRARREGDASHSSTTQGDPFGLGAEEAFGLRDHPTRGEELWKRKRKTQES
ncbi:hypothetical protein ACCAA_570021 [Candidatus Accumulibacter aalborgensis]|uniref:Uncharacterized protein n=1 Tax=Candidatus Accumulibacter aalborgensis TaxID=1860102 RepID=A0A1A8XUK5_9PROT|nr:hypothetical protein ACCAA_570021 [Candidatus Accumulibacter aalborgensis]